MKSRTPALLRDLVENFDNVRVPLSAKERVHLAKTYPYYGAQSIIDYVDRYLFDGTYILVAEDGENLKSQKKDVCSLVSGKFWVNNHAHILQAKGDNDTIYLYYLLNSVDFRPYVTGSAQPKLTKDNLELIKLQVHVAADQRKIAKVLSTLDAKIELNQRMNEELEGMAKLLYDYWFVQYDFPMSAAQAAALGKPHLTGQPYRASGGPMTYNETLKREIPVGWEVKEVGEVLAKESQTKKIPASEVLKSGRFPVVDQSKDFVCGFTNDGDAVIEGTPQIIFGDHTRILKFINFAFARGADGTQLLMSNTKRLPPPLFYQALQRIDLSSYGYARHFKFLKQSKVLLPEEDIAAKYERVAMSCYDLIRQNLVQTQELTTLRDWLLPMLMNGQVVVS